MEINYCSNCGAKISEGSKFCGKCGQKIIQLSQNIKSLSKQCPKCGKKFENDEMYCKNCGTIISESIDVKKTEVQPKHTQNFKRKKKGGILRIIGRTLLGIFIFIVIGSIILYNLDDKQDNTSINKETTHNTAVIQEPINLKKAANKMEAVFKEADTTQLKLLLTKTSFKTYQGVYSEIEPYMSEYAKAFKSRKLIELNKIFALYSFEDDEGNKFTAEFTSTDSENWKLTRF